MRITRLLLSGFTALALVLAPALPVSAQQEPGVDNSPDCDSVAIIKCGSFTEAELKSDFDKNEYGDLQKVFGAFGIERGELNGFVDGVVWKDGRVTVNGKLVATGAVTAGRWDTPPQGATRIEGTQKAYKMAPSNFTTTGQTAFVKMVNGKFSFAVIKSCGNPVSAKPEQPKPEEEKPQYKCVDLQADKLSRTKFRFTAKGEATNGATIEKYEFGFGDGMGITVNELTYTYDYKKTGTFETSVVLHIKVDGKIVKADGPQCKKSVTVADKEKPEEPVKAEPCPHNPDLPNNSPKCVKKENCPTEGKKHLPKNSPDCKEDEQEVLPATIAETGPAQLLGAGIGATSLTTATYYWLQSRRKLRGDW